MRSEDRKFGVAKKCWFCGSLAEAPFRTIGIYHGNIYIACGDCVEEAFEDPAAFANRHPEMWTDNGNG